MRRRSSRLCDSLNWAKQFCSIRINSTQTTIQTNEWPCVLNLQLRENGKRTFARTRVQWFTLTMVTKSSSDKQMELINLKCISRSRCNSFDVPRKSIEPYMDLNKWPGHADFLLKWQQQQQKSAKINKQSQRETI